MITCDDSVAHWTDSIRFALAPYCCGPGESFTIEPVQDSHSTIHNDTYLWLDMTWERLRGYYLRDSIKLIYALCKSVLDRSTLQRIVVMTGQPPSLQAVAAARKQFAPAIKLPAPPLITHLAERAERLLPLQPTHAIHQDDMVPVTRMLKNGSEIVIGWRKPDGPMVVSFDPVVTKDGGYNRKRRLRRRLCQNTQFGSNKKLSRRGMHIRNQHNNITGIAG